MTREEQLACLEDRPCAVCNFYTDGCSRWTCVFEEKPEEQEPCDDAVSRQALIDKATSWDAHFADSERVVSLTDIVSLPSVQPQPKTGEWIKKIEPYEAEPFTLWECSKCHMKVRGSMKSDYCPFCGARMNGGGEE